MTVCKYPDGDGGMESGKHILDKDGYCIICGDHPATIRRYKTVVTIIVNGNRHTVKVAHELRYRDLVRLAGYNNHKALFTITVYDPWLSIGRSIEPGGYIMPKHNMVFNVMQT